MSAALALGPTAIAAHAHAQTWPSRFVRVIVPFPPGPGIDAPARVIASRLSDIWGVQVAVDNRPGSGGSLGTQAVARSEPDGLTLLFNAPALVLNHLINSSAGYDPVADFVPISLVCTYPVVMLVPNSSPAKSVLEFIDFAKANRGNVTFGSPGTGTTQHLAGELFKRAAGIEMTHVPYRGLPPALNDLIPGRISLLFGSPPLLEQAKAGQVRALAVTSDKRFPPAPDLPTVSEAGLAGFNVSGWYAFLAPAKTPGDVVSRINAGIVAALADPSVNSRLGQLGLVVVGSSPSELAAFLGSEIDKWRALVTQAGIKADE